MKIAVMAAMYSAQGLHCIDKKPFFPERGFARKTMFIHSIVGAVYDRAYLLDSRSSAVIDRAYSS
jgi:hypothetical protein